MDPLKDDLLKLVRIPGPSGFEAPVAQFISREISPFVDRVELDGAGNQIGRASCRERV
jgi:putative aminopeptidase FrvX